MVGSDARTIDETIRYADATNIMPVDDRLNRHMNECAYAYRKISELPYKEFINYHKYKRGLAPQMTQHGVKGAEYENVLIVLDNGGWNNYNFNDFLT